MAEFHNAGYKGLYKGETADDIFKRKNWLKQWFMIVSIDYLKMPKKKRQKEMIHVIESIRNSYLYDDYYRIKKDVEQYTKEHNINENEIEHGEYPKEIDW